MFETGSPRDRISVLIPSSTVALCLSVHDMRRNLSQLAAYQDSRHVALPRYLISVLVMFSLADMYASISSARSDETRLGMKRTRSFTGVFLPR
jgi:hypothetical protein